MKERFFVVDKKYLEEKKHRLIIREENFYHHIKNVLRLKRERISVSDGEGRIYKVRLKDFSKEWKVEFILEKIEEKEPKPIKIRILQAIPNRISKLEDFIKKAAELGIDEFIPILSKYSVQKDININRCERIAKGAAALAHLPFLLKIREPTTYKEAIRRIREEFSQTILLTPKQAELNLKDIDFKETKSINLIVGPEGGFSEEELEFAKREGIKTVFLGDNILSTEFAGIVAAVIILYKIGKIG